MNGVRWSQAEQQFEGRCDACCHWWPLAPESRSDFWPVSGRGLRICRACDRLKAHARRSLGRADPSRVEKDRAYSRAYHAALSPEERRALRRIDGERLERRRAYNREYQRRWRAARRGVDANV